MMLVCFIMNFILNRILIKFLHFKGKVKWLDIDNTLKLYASHKDFIEKTAKLHKALW
jgi:hypothetical protein